MRSGAIGEKQKHSVKFPEKSLFNTLSPSKVDQRKIALQRYLQQLISTPLDRISDICEFLSTDVIQQEEANMVSSYWHTQTSIVLQVLLIHAKKSVGIQRRIFDKTRQKFWRLEETLFCH
jgi:hypothetical protein